MIYGTTRFKIGEMRSRWAYLPIYKPYGAVISFSYCLPLCSHLISFSEQYVLAARSWINTPVCERTAQSSGGLGSESYTRFLPWDWAGVHKIWIQTRFHCSAPCRALSNKYMLVWITSLFRSQGGGHEDVMCFHPVYFTSCLYSM